MVAPLFLTIILGLVGAGWLFFMNQAVTDAARAAAREAAIKDPLVQTASTWWGGAGSDQCETPSNALDPQTIQSAAQQAANILAVNTSTLCQPAVAANCSTYDLSCTPGAQVLIQQPGTTPASVEIQVQSAGTLEAATTVSATVTYTEQLPLPVFSLPITFQATSTLPTQCVGPC